MEPDTQIRTKYCRNCKSRIKMAHFDIHSARCLHLQKPPSARKQKQQHNSKHIPQEQGTEQDTPSGKQQGLLPRACGTMSMPADLQIHLPECRNTEVKCNFCQFPFPTCIIDEHNALCSHNPDNNFILSTSYISSPSISQSLRNSNNSSIVMQSSNGSQSNVSVQSFSQSIHMNIKSPSSLEQRSHITENSNIFNNLAQNLPNIFHSRPPKASQQNKNIPQFQKKHQIHQKQGKQDTQNHNQLLAQSNVPSTSDYQRNQRNKLFSSIYQPSNINESQSGTESSSEQITQTITNPQYYSEQNSRIITHLQNESIQITQFRNRLRLGLLRKLQENYQRLEENTQQIKSYQERIEKGNKTILQIVKQRERIIEQLYQINQQSIQITLTIEQIQQQNVQRQRFQHKIQQYTQSIIQIRQHNIYLRKELAKSKQKQQQIKQQQQQIIQSIEEIGYFVERLFTVMQLANRYNENSNSNGLTQAQIANILDMEYVKRADEEAEKCAICFCQIAQKQLIKNLPCRHTYHTQCISKWLRVNPTCPLCKRSVETVDTTDNENFRNTFRPLVIVLRSNGYIDRDESVEQVSSIFSSSFQQR